MPYFLQRFLLPFEYASFLLCLFYWLSYSLIRVKGIPLLFGGFDINSSYTALLAFIVLFFNALFFSRLLIELINKENSLRTNLTRFLFARYFFVIIFITFIAFVTGGRFDYASYKLQWSLIGSGGNPWGFIQGGMVNAYGYTFNFLAIFNAINPILPKILFVLLLIYFSYRLAFSLPSSNATLALFLCINPFTASTVAVYGFIDGLSCILLGLALLELLKESARASLMSGIYLALSFMTKFYSVSVLPVFVAGLIGSNRIRFMSGLLATSALVLTVAYLLWGNTIVTPILFAQGRDPSFLTFWKYLGQPQLRSIVFATISCIAIILGTLRSSLSPSIRAAAVLSIVFGAYYLGHQQFYLGIFIPLAVYIIEVVNGSRLRFKRAGLWSLTCVFGWLIFIQTGFEFFDEFKPIGFQGFLPLLSVVNSLLLISVGFYWLSVNLTRSVGSTYSTANSFPD